MGAAIMDWKSRWALARAASEPVPLVHVEADAADRLCCAAYAMRHDSHLVITADGLQALRGYGFSRSIAAIKTAFVRPIRVLAGRGRNREPHCITLQKPDPASSVPLIAPSDSKPSVIAHDVSLACGLDTDGNLVVEGEIQGDVRCASLMLRNGAIRGDVTSGRAEIAGKVGGSVRCVEALLTHACRIGGNLNCRNWREFKADPGARVDGQAVPSAVLDSHSLALLAKIAGRPRPVRDLDTECLAGLVKDRLVISFRGMICPTVMGLTELGRRPFRRHVAHISKLFASRSREDGDRAGHREKRGPNRSLPRSVIEGGLLVKSDILTAGDLSVEDGIVLGNVRCRQLAVGKDAAVKGTVIARRIVIDGYVEGPIRAAEVVLEAGTNIRCDIYTNSLQIRKGATFEGASHRLDKAASGVTEGDAAHVKPATPLGGPSVPARPSRQRVAQRQAA
jgi:cytoskeletal protein CcmA (bactofilin family)